MIKIGAVLKVQFQSKLKASSETQSDSCVSAARRCRLAPERLPSPAGYEAMKTIRKGQIRWLAKGDVLGPVHYIEQIFGVAA